MSAPVRRYPRLVGVHIDHRRQGEPSRAFLTINRGLRSGKLDEVDLTTDELLALIADGSRILQTLLRRGTS